MNDHPHVQKDAQWWLGFAFLVALVGVVTFTALAVAGALL